MTSVDVQIGRKDDSPPPPRRPRAVWHAIANAVVLIWLALTVITVVGHAWATVPPWSAIHMFLLGGVTNAIVTWTEHFATALLRLRPPDARWQVGRLAALNTGVIAVLTGVGVDLPALATGGAAVVVAVVAAHAAVLAAGARHALGGRFAHVARWYVCSGAALVVGGTLGGLMTSGRLPADWYPRIVAAHLHANLLGWVGLAVLGTLFTLWPTVLRTRVVEGSDAVARRSLTAAAPALALAVAGLLCDLRWVAAAGLLLFAAAAAVALAPFVRTVRRRRPHGAAAWMLAAGTGWFAAAVAADAAVVATRPPGEVAALISDALPLVLAGFVGQTLAGALTYLLPVVMGGGPAALKTNTALLERFWIVRTAALNIAVPLTVLPLPDWGVRAAWAVVLAAFGAFVLLAAAVVVRSRTRVRRPSPAVAGVLAGTLLTALAVGVAVGGGTDGSGTQRVASTGTRVVDVALADMRVRPGTIEAPRGTELVLKVTNKDAQRHDLRMETGEATPMLEPGESATLRLEPLAGDIEGWCTVVGHRAAGMTMQIRTTGTAAEHGGADHGGTEHGGTEHGGAEHEASGGALDLAADPGPDWRPYDASLEPAPGATEHRVKLHAVQKVLEVAPGVRQRMWTFGGTVPGPVLRGKVGDLFTITLVNDDAMGHGIDFHAGSMAPDGAMRTIEPGESHTFSFRAEHAGAWLYHCSTAPMLQHMGNGMYGAVIIDPPDLPEADREYVLVQSELYLGAPGGAEQVAKMRDGRPDAWMFNGTAAGYDHAPLEARADERVRVWVVAAGPSGGTAFHIVGAQFDTLYKEGAYRLRPGDPGGAQILDLAPGQGGFVETVVPEAGHYPFVDHGMRRAASGAHGILEVTG